MRCCDIKESLSALSGCMLRVTNTPEENQLFLRALKTWDTRRDKEREMIAIIV